MKLLQQIGQGIFIGIVASLIIRFDVVKRLDTYGMQIAALRRDVEDSLRQLKKHEIEVKETACKCGIGVTLTTDGNP